jgi:uncharacterized protein YfaS (alpha-2-macroglobulin family)
MKRQFPLWQIAIFILMVVSLACNWSLPGAPSFFATPVPPTATPVPLPPTIIETEPPVGSEIALQPLLTIYFSEKMDRASVEAALSGDFPGGFVFSWVDDSILTLAPKAALPSNQRVTFTLAATAKSAAGLAALEPVSFSYQTPGPLRVSQILPAAMAENVSPDSAVVVAFNQPVVPLGADSATLPAGLTLEPAAQGQGEWLNTSTYIFHPDPGLSGGIQYTARVNPKLVSTNGMALDENSQNTTWVFSAARPEVIGFQFRSQPGPDFIKAVGFEPPAQPFRNISKKMAGISGTLPLDPEFEITFNQPMDQASVEDAFSLKLISFDDSVDNSKAENIPGVFKWNEKFSVLVFTPEKLLEREKTYKIVVGGASKAKLVMDKNYERYYLSPVSFYVEGTSFPNGGMRPTRNTALPSKLHAYGTGGYGLPIQIAFSTPLAKYTDTELAKLITVSPKMSEVGFYLEETRLTVSGLFTPGKTYAITFSANLKDRWGMALGQDFVFTFTEPDAAPSLSAGYQQTLFTRPEDPILSVQAVNLNEITVSRGSLSLDDFLRIEMDYNYQQNFTPEALQTWTVKPGLPRNDNQPVAINLHDGPLTPGFYYVNLDSPEIEFHNNTSRTLLVSNLNVTLKVNATEILLWAMDLRTQTPVQNVSVTLYDSKGGQAASGKTDENGLWRGLPRAEMAGHSIYAILGQPGDDQFGAANSNWNQGISPWEFGVRTDSSGPNNEVYLYSERPVYRPGDVVYYRGILRNWYDGRYSDSGISNVELTWFGVDGEIDKQQAVVSPYGTFDGKFNLPANSPPGSYSFTVASNGKDLSGGSLYFTVADYRKPEMNLSAEISPQTAKSGQPLTGTVHAAYFFGTPVTDLPFTWSLYTRRSYFSIPQFSSGVQSSRWLTMGDGGQFGSPYLSGKGRTDENGNFSIPLTNLKVDDTSEITLEITATESGGYPVSARATAILHPESFYIGVRPETWVGQAGSPLGFNFLSVDWDKNPVSQPLTVALQKVRWERDDLEYGYSFTPVYTPVESKSVTSSADGKASLSFTPPEAGTYALDVRSGSAHTQRLIWVTGGQNAEWPNLPHQQIDLTVDKDKYKPGETAEVFIPNPFNTPALALLTTERSTFKTVEIITVPAEGYKFNLPLTDESAPNIYVSATLLGPQDVDFRQGYVNLEVDASAFILNVDLKATPEKAKPGDMLTLDLTVTDSKGQPVQGEFSLAVVDLAALALAEPNSEEIVPAYYDIQPLGVTTGLTAAIYTRRLLKFPGGKGGGGGEDIMTLREKFPDTAYWKADILTDAQGKGRVTLTLPDNLTTWEIDSRGLTKDTKVGQARVRVVTSKDLLIRPQTPRFLVVGDQATLAAMVNNTTNQPLEATVSLQATGLILDDPATAEQKVSVPANGRLRVVWRGLVQAGEAVDAIFLVKAGDLQDASRPNDGPIPVLRYSAPQTFSTAGMLTGAATRQEIIALPRSFQALGGNLQVELSPSLSAAILGSLKAIKADENPWSTEQIVSTFLPNVATYRALQESGLEDADLTKRLQTNLAGDLRRLLALQREDGGWPWAASSAKSDPYLTAYAIFGLQQAAESGLTLEGIDLAEKIQKGRDYVLSNIYTFTGETSVAGEFNRAAFYLYVLEKTGGLNDYASVADLLYESRTKLEPWAKSLLALTLYGLSPNDERAKTLLSDVESSAIRSATGAHWESTSGNWMNPGTPLFTTAIVLSALAERNPATPLTADAARYLASQRDANGRWASPYESAWVTLALNKHMTATGELRGDYAFSATLNGAPLVKGQASGPQNMTTVTTSAPLTQLNLSGANSLLISKLDGTGKLYYRAALTVDRPVETAPALERGMTISRQFLACAQAACQPVTSYQLNPDESGRVTVRVTVTLPNDAYYLMVQDFIPAGAEILDSSLKTSQQGEQDQVIYQQYDPADPFGAGWGWWYFNRPQIYKDHILWSADYLPAGTYSLTYTIVPSLVGQYRVLPAHAWQAYFPEVQGTSAGAVFEIK